VRRLLAEKRLDPEHYKNILLHRVDGGAALAQFGAASKVRADMIFLKRLFTLGRHAGKAWLMRHYADLGQRSSLQSVSSDESFDDLPYP